MENSDIDLVALAKDVRYLRDRAEIQDIIALYCRGLDRLDADALNRAYHKDAIDRHASFYGDRDAFVPWSIELETQFPRTHHNITTQIIELDGDVAHAESYCLFYVIQPGGEHLGAGAARYLDRLERRDGRWAIAARLALVEFGHEMPRSNWLGDAWEEVPSRRDREDYAYQRPLVPPPVS